MLGKHGAHRFQMVHECGHQGFHAFDRNGVGDGFEHVLSIGNRTDQGFGAGAHGVGQLQFTACGGPNGLEAVAVGTLVGGVEFLDGVNFVAEEFDTHRVRCGGREYVKNASAHRELATVHDQVHARIGVFDQTFGGFVEGQVLPHGEHERLDIAQSLDDWLDERADRHDENANRAEHRIGIGSDA